MNVARMMKYLLVLAASIHITANAGVLAYGKLNPHDTSQTDCIRTISSIPYSEAVVGPDGKYIMRLEEDLNTGVITTEIYARSVLSPHQESFVPNVYAALRTRNSNFETSAYEGNVRDVVSIFGNLPSNLFIVSEFQTSSEGLNPRPADIIPLSRSELSITQNEIKLSRTSLMKSADIGIRIPMVVAKSFRALNCTFERTY